MAGRYRGKLPRAFASEGHSADNPLSPMEPFSKVVLVLVAVYVGMVAGFVLGYIANARILRGYRDEAEELRTQLYLTLRDAQ